MAWVVAVKLGEEWLALSSGYGGERSRRPRMIGSWIAVDLARSYSRSYSTTVNLAEAASICFE